MSSPAEAIPDLERLMRSVLRDAFTMKLGPDWLNGLSASVRQVIDRAAEQARKQRPTETLRDAWEAVVVVGTT